MCKPVLNWKFWPGRNNFSGGDPLHDIRHFPNSCRNPIMGSILTHINTGIKLPAPQVAVQVTHRHYNPCSAPDNGEHTLGRDHTVLFSLRMNIVMHSNQGCMWYSKISRWNCKARLARKVVNVAEVAPVSEVNLPNLERSVITTATTLKPNVAGK